MVRTILKGVTAFLILTGACSLGAAPLPKPRKINTDTSQLDRLDPKRISEADCRSWHPAELVAIVGLQRGRHWHHVGRICHSSDGKRIVAWEGDFHGCFVHLWVKHNLHYLTSLPMPSTYIRFIPQKESLLTCSTDDTLRLWDVSTAKPTERKLIRGPFGGLRYSGTAASSDGTKLVSDRGETIDIYDLRTSPPKRSTLPIRKGNSPRGESFSLSSTAFSHDGQSLATLTYITHDTFPGSWGGGPWWNSDQKVTLWDISGPQPKKRCVLNGICNERDEVAFSPDGKTLIVGGNVWALSEGKPKLRARMAENDEQFQACVFSSDSRYGITTSLKNERLCLHVRDMQPRIPRLIQTIPLAGHYCGALDLAPDGKSIAVGEMNTMRVWPIKDGKIQVPSRTFGHLSDVFALSFGACGNLLATASKDATLRLWDLDGTHPHHRLVLKGDLNLWGGDTNPWDSIALSPDGTKLAAASQKHGLTIWNVSSRGLRVLAKHECGILTPPSERWGVPPPPPLLLAFTPDSKSLFLANGTNPVKVIDLAKPSASATELKTWERVIYRNVAKRVPVAGQVVNPVEPETIKIREPFNVYALAVSPNGQTLAVATPHEIAIWERTETGWHRRTGFWYLSHSVHSMAFERSSKTLLVGSRSGNGEVRRFDISSEKPVQLGEPIVQEWPNTSVAASPNGKFLAAADEGGRVVVWSAGMAKKLHEWKFPGPVHCVSFAPDGRHLALGNGDGTVYILRLAVPAKE